MVLLNAVHETRPAAQHGVSGWQAKEVRAIRKYREAPNDKAIRQGIKSRGRFETLMLGRE